MKLRVTLADVTLMAEELIERYELEFIDRFREPVISTLADNLNTL